MTSMKQIGLQVVDWPETSFKYILCPQCLRLCLWTRLISFSNTRAAVEMLSTNQK